MNGFGFTLAQLSDIDCGTAVTLFWKPEGKRHNLATSSGATARGCKKCYGEESFHLSLSELVMRIKNSNGNSSPTNSYTSKAPLSANKLQPSLEAQHLGFASLI